MKRLLVVVALLLLLTSLVRADPSNSIYHLQIALTDQGGLTHGLDLHRGHPVLVTMFYGSCPMACPLLIDTMRTVERSLSPAERDQVRFLLISIDPQRDTITKLQVIATDRKLDTKRWTLARTDASSVRKIAAILGVQYRLLPDGSYNHSSIVTLLTPEGEIARQSSLLSKPDAELISALRGLL